MRRNPAVLLITVCPVIPIGYIQFIINITLHIPAMFPAGLQYLSCCIQIHQMLIKDSAALTARRHRPGIDHHGHIPQVKDHTPGTGRLKHPPSSNDNPYSLCFDLLQHFFCIVRNGNIIPEQGVIQINGHKFYIRLHTIPLCIYKQQIMINFMCNHYTTTRQGGCV